MAFVVIVVGLGIMIWALARAGVFRAFGRKAPKNKIVTERRAIGGLPGLPMASDFRPVFRYEFLGPLRALGDVGDDDEAQGLEALTGCARGRVHGRNVWMYSRRVTEGPSGGSDEKFLNCGVVEVGADLPRLEVSATNAVASGSALPMEGASPFSCPDSAEFADSFRVTTQDADFARELLDEPMRRFLLAQNNTWSFGFGGNYVVVRAGELDAVGVERFLEAAVHLRDVIPETVRRRFPAQTPDAS